MAKLSKGGEWHRLMKDIAADRDLTSEIRDGRLTVYYQKGRLLEIRENKINVLDPGYYNGCTKYFVEKIQNGVFSNNDVLKQPVVFDPNNAKPYLKWAKIAIGVFNFIHNKKEFIIQQRIMKENISKNSNYLAVDLEYQFEQGSIPIDQRIDKSRIDIVAIEKNTNDIVLFELKQGSGAVDGKSGIEDHIRKTNIHLANAIFCENLRNDLSQIISQKIDLGLLNCDKGIITKIQKSKIKMGFIFVTYTEQDEKEIVKLMKGHEDILAIWKDYSCELYAHHHPLEK